MKLHELVPLPNAPPAQPQPRAGAGAWGDRQPHLALHRGHFQRRAQNGLANGDRQFDDDVVALAVEQRMWRDRDFHQRVAGFALAHTGHALAFQP